MDLSVTILALIQGLTEFLPVSSSGHLTIGQYFLPGFDEPDVLLDVWLHVGTLAATVLAYRKDILDLIVRSMIKRETAALKVVAMLIIGSVPTAAIGLFFKESLEAAFAAPSWVALNLMLTGGILVLGQFVGNPRSATNRQIGIPVALLIGTVQGFAILPGISRSGSTVVAAMLCGVARPAAARYSFLLSIPAIAGATLLQTRDVMNGHLQGTNVEFTQLLFGALLAFVSGYFALRAFLKLLNNGMLLPFAGYCLLLGGGFFTWLQF